MIADLFNCQILDDFIAIRGYSLWLGVRPPSVRFRDARRNGAKKIRFFCCPALLDACLGG